MLGIYFIILWIILIYYYHARNYEFFRDEIKKWDKTLKQKKYFIAIVAIFKNENDYLDEWLEFHIKQGIEHFYMYDNNTNAGKDIVTLKIFNKYKDKITHIIWNDVKTTGGYTVQRKAYQDCYDQYRNEFQWIFLSDLDEFSYSTLRNKTIKDIVIEYANTNTPYIKVPRFDFGNNQHIRKQEGNVVKNYTKRQNNISSYKSISNVDYINGKYKTMGVHRYIYTTNDNAINKQLKISCSLPETSSNIPIIMNHYYTKSYEEYIKKCLMWNKKPINYLGKRSDCFNTSKFNKLNHNQVKDMRAYNIMN